MISDVQLRAARAALDLNQTELAVAAGVDLATIVRAESPGDSRRRRRKTVEKIVNALEGRGVIFISFRNGIGVLSSGQIASELQRPNNTIA